MRTRVLVSWLLSLAISVLVLPLGLAHAAELNIPAQPLGEALRELGNQTKLNVLFETQQLRGLTAPAVKGAKSAEDALSQLLKGTGLTYRFIEAGTVTVVRIASASGPQTGAATGATALGLAEPSSFDTGRDPSLRVAQNPSSPGDGRTTGSDQPSDTTAENKKEEIQEIVVTATKRNERLVDTPQSVTVLSADNLAKLGANQFRDFAAIVPGLSFTTGGAGLTQTTLRGVTTGIDVSKTTATYVDEVPYGSTTSFASGGQIALDVGLFDLDRIEVLRGPQGTLYGASTLGGLIKYVTRQPDTENFGASAQAGVSGTHYGSANYNVAAAVNVPIMIDKLAVRAGGFESHDGGYTDNVATGKNDVNHSDIYGGRLDLLFKPTDALAIRVTGFLQDVSQDGFPVAEYTLAGVPVYGSLQARRRSPDTIDQQFRLASGIVDYNFGPAILTSISSYQTSRIAWLEDASNIYAPLLQAALGRSYSSVNIGNHGTTKKFTQEVRLASKGTDSLEWLIGGFYTHESSAYGQDFGLRDLAGEPAVNDLFHFVRPSIYKEYSAFGDLTWRITHKFDLTGGLRYAHNDQRFDQTGSGLLSSSAPTLLSSDNVVTYLANTRYHFNDHATAYLRYATGYRPGGANVPYKDPITKLPVASPTFEPDQLASYEAGFKAETPDGRYGLDLAGYYINWTNIQIVAVRNGLSGKANAAGATVRGAELSLTAKPTSNATLTGAFGYQDPTLSEASADLKAAKGERLPFVPHFTANLNADYALGFGNLRPTIGGTLRYVGERTASFNAATSPPQYHFPAYTTVDLRTGVTLQTFNVQLYVHNLFDKRGQMPFPFSTISPATGPFLVSISQPRTVGLTVTAKFQ